MEQVFISSLNKLSDALDKNEEALKELKRSIDENSVQGLSINNSEWIPRETFSNIVQRIFDNNKEDGIYDLFYRFADYGLSPYSHDFMWWKDDNDDYYILHKESGMMVTWYKHIGRANYCSQPWRTVAEFDYFLTELHKEYAYAIELEKSK